MAKEIARTSSRTTSKTHTQSAGELAQSAPDYIRQLSKNTTASSVVPDLAPEDAKTMAAVFTRMKSIYGHLWSSNFREESQLKLAQAEWIAAFRRARVTQGDVSKALDWMVSSGADMPNLPRFMEVAKMMRNQRITSGPLKLPKKKTPEEQARDRAYALEQIRRIRTSL